MSKPHLFIGSSQQAVDTARNIATVLNDGTSPILAKVWKDGGTFVPTRATLENLLNELHVSEFGAFVLAPDDVVSSQGRESYRTRDNVVFELGLFLGNFGTERTFVICATDPLKTVTLPSDLFAVSILRFEHDPSDPLASVTGVCQRMRLAIQRVLTEAELPTRAAHVITQLELELSDRTYEPISLKLDRSTTSKVSFHFSNPKRADVKFLDICFPPEIDVNFLPWTYKIKEDKDAHAANMRYFWLTKDQLQNLYRPEGFRFLLHGRAKGNYEMKIVAKVGSNTIVESIRVHVE